MRFENTTGWKRKYDSTGQNVDSGTKTFVNGSSAASDLKRSDMYYVR